MSRIPQASKCVTEFQLVTPAAAKKGLRRVIKQQRAVQQAIVDKYAQAMLAGQYDGTAQTLIYAQLPANVAEAAGYDIPQGELYVRIMINGVHTSHAIVKADKPIWINVRIIICATVDEMLEHYRRIDKGTSRSAQDSLRAYQDSWQYDVPTKLCKSLIDAIWMIKFNFSTHTGYDKAAKKVTNFETQLDELKPWLPTAEKFLKILAGGNSHVNKRLKTPVFMGPALLAVAKLPEQAAAFLRLVSTGDRLAADDPRAVLREWLGRPESLIGPGNSNGEAARRFAAAWNAWWRGQTITKLQMSKGGVDSPFTMVGVTETAPRPAAKKFLFGPQSPLPFIMPLEEGLGGVPARL